MAEITLPTEIRLDIVTPDHLVAHDSVTEVTIPGKDGYLGILPGHAPLLTQVVPGEMEYTCGGSKQILVVTAGFAEVLGDRVRILVDAAERAEEIDVPRAERAKDRAEELLQHADSTDPDAEAAREALRRAIARLETAHKHSA